MDMRFGTWNIKMDLREREREREDAMVCMDWTGTNGGLL
jgi:hypothetical protein